MTFFYDKDGIQQLSADAIGPHLYKEAEKAGKSVAQHINTVFANADMKYGNAFTQICASAGLVLSCQDDPFGAGSAKLADILSGESAPQAAVNTGKKTDPYGVQSRSLFPAFVIQATEDLIQPDRTTDDRIFRSMAATTVPVAGNTFTQPILSYGNAGGANQGAFGASEGRVIQGALVPTVLFLTTSDRYRKIPTYGISVEYTDEALKHTTLDLFTLTMGRFFQIEKDKRVYRYISNLYSGDADLNIGAVSAVTTTSLDSAATGGIVTHKAWLKWLAGGVKRKKRKITHVMCNLDTYLKVESRTGRPGTNNYDPTLARIDPQLLPGNQTFGGDVVWMIVDDASAGGPVPDNTVYGLDKAQAFIILKNTEADYQATEQFALKRSNATVWHWSEEVARLYGDAELTAFDVLTIL